MKLIYTDFRKDGIFGKLYVDGISDPFCVTLSHAYDNGDGGWFPIVSTGSYKCVRGMHELANGIPFVTFEITGIKGHGGLLFHAGNWNADSHGCTLVGNTIVTDAKSNWMITQSKVTFAKFMELLEGVDEFQLEVSDARLS